MRPGEQGEIILEDETERAHALKGAALTQNSGLAEHLHRRFHRVFADIHDEQWGQVGREDRDFQDTSWMTYADPGVPALSPEALRRRSADQRARSEFAYAEVSLDPLWTNDVLQGLQAVANLNALRAARHRVSRSVARKMLEGYQQ